MKLSTNSPLFGVMTSALLVAASNNRAFGVSASDIGSSDLSESYDPMSFDPDMDRLSLEGLDPSVPLTDEEAAFLEAAIQDVINEIHEDKGIDLYAEAVSVGTHAILPNFVNSTSAIEDEGSNNLRGRNLERGFRGKPQIDNYCHYISGPNKGQWRPGCEFNIDLYVCCRCWMCFDDDMTLGWSWRPTFQPVSGPTTRKPTPMPTLSFRDNMKFHADDDFFDRPTKEPTSNPTVEPTAKPTSKPTFKPTAKPTAKPTNNRRRRRRRNNNRRGL